MRARRYILMTTAMAGLLLGGLAATGTVVVRRGDTVSELAQANGTTVAAIARANGLADPDRIYVGQVLRVPGSGSSASSSMRGVSAVSQAHVVRPGETLGAIARRYRTTVTALARANGISDPNRILAGFRLRLGAGFAAVVPQRVATAATHTVRPGETLGAIARRYGTTVGALARANGIADPDVVAAGARLRVPGTGWQCPVPGAQFADDFGLARGNGRWHEGNDVFAPRNTPVHAPVSGRVDHTRGPVGGLPVRLWGDDGALYIGSHLERAGASGRVGAGTVIGFVGNSGNARGASTHLHFEIHPRQGAAANPYSTLRQACG